MGRIDRYWRDRLGLRDELDREGVHVVPHAGQAGDDLVYVLVRDDAAVVSVPRSLVQSTRDRVRHVAPSDLLDPARIHHVVDQPISHCVGPLYEGYADAEGFVAKPSRAVITLDRSHLQAVQAFTAACERVDSEVTSVWRDVLRRFVTASSPTDFEHSGLARGDSPLFARVDESGVLALAHYSMWAVDAASIGVLTHPEHRRRGHGKAVVGAAMSDAFSQGFLVLYRTLLANRASVALAESLGCRDYARFLAVHLRRGALPHSEMELSSHR
jgi:RimJ/RimL family protein N-acetyltransferase